MQADTFRAANERVLFVSHSGLDTDEARKLVERIRAAPAARVAGLRVWFAGDDLQAGRPWQAQIEEALRCSTAFAVYIGSRGIANWVDAEVRIALNRAIGERGYAFVPILSPSAPPPETLPGFVQQFQAVVADASTEWLERLMAASLGQTAHPLEEHPFFGLRAIDESRSHLFFGRERETTEVVERLQQTPLLMVVGDSGCGKSSLLKAGVVPKFRGGAMASLRGERPQDDIWHVVMMQPRANPRQQLGEAIYEVGATLGLSKDDRRTFAGWAATGDITDVRRALRCELPRERTRVLLVIDQFEELWTSTEQPARESFLGLAVELAGSEEGSIRVVLTMRQDYVNLCSDYEPLRRLLDAKHGQARYDLRRMDEHSLQLVVTEPLRLAGIERGKRDSLAVLVTRHVGERPGELALVQMALTEAWNVRSEHEGDLLRAYVHVGGVEGALAQAAEKVRSNRDERAREQIDAILIRLVQLGDTGGATRRVARRSEFDVERWKLVEFLASEQGKRLLLLAGNEDQPTVEIAHEALVTAWPHFQRMLQRCAGDKRVLDKLIDRVSEWRAVPAQARPEHLATGAQLEAYVRLQRSRATWLSDDEQQFVESSRAAAERVQKRARRMTRGLQALTVIALVLAGTAMWFGVTARVAEDRAVREAANVLTQQGGHLLQQGYPERAAVYLSKAYGLTPTAIDVRAWLPEATRALALATFEHGGPVGNAGFSSDGRRVVTVSVFGPKQWDAHSGRLVFNLEGPARGMLTAAAFSPDGARVLTAKALNAATLWDAHSGELSATLEGHGDVVASAEFSPDGARVLTVSHDGAAKVWDAHSGELSTTLEGHADRVASAAFSPDGARVLIAGHDATANLWDARSGKLLFNLVDHAGGVLDAAFSPDGARVLTASLDKTAKLWDAHNGTLLTTLTGHADAVWSAAFSPDGRCVVTTSYDKTAKLWDADSGKLLTTFEGHVAAVGSVAFSPDGSRVVTASLDRTAKLWDADSGKLLATFEGHAEAVASVVFSPDGGLVLTASSDGTAKLWDAHGSKLSSALHHAAPVLSAAFSPDGGRVITMSSDRTAKLWDAHSGKFLATLDGHPDAVWSAASSPALTRDPDASDVKIGRLVRWLGNTRIEFLSSLAAENAKPSAAFSPDGRRILTVNNDRTAKLWDARSLELLATLEVDSERVWSAAFDADGSRVVTTSSDNTTKLWDAHDGKLLRTLEGPSAWAWSAAFSPDGKRVVSASRDTANLWDAHSGKLLARLSGGAKLMSSAAFSPDGGCVVSASSDNTAKLWDADSGKLLVALEGHASSVVSATFSPDGLRVLTTSYDKTAKLWDAHTGKPLATLDRHLDQVHSAAFSPDGTRVVTASADKTAKLWDSKSGKLLTTLDAHASAVSSAAFSPDGTRVVTASADATAKLWDVQLENRPPEEVASDVSHKTSWTLKDGLLQLQRRSIARR